MSDIGSEEFDEDEGINLGASIFMLFLLNFLYSCFKVYLTCETESSLQTTQLNFIGLQSKTTKLLIYLPVKCGNFETVNVC